MSHQVTVNFEGLSIQIQAQCEIAASSLCKIDKTLENVRKNASKIESTKLKEYEKYLLDSKEKLQKELDKVTAKVEKYKSLKIQTLGNPYTRDWHELNGRLKNEANSLSQLASELTGSKLAVINELVNEGLLNEINRASLELDNQINGVKSFDNELLNQVNAIDDISLRELAYQEILKGTKNFTQVLENAQIEYDKLLNKSSYVEELKQEMKASGVSNEEINNILSKPITAKVIDEMTVNANAAIQDEKIRKETLKIIIKTIKDRGFIVDTKKNLKINKEKNIVKLVAIKPDGKTAMFEISLNGKFMYRFEGYEGQACNKDITPFIEDLKNVYDINILHEEVEWSNPDKIQMQKYQHMNTNKGKN